MPPARITQFFRRPSFAAGSQDPPLRSEQPSDAPAAAPQSSPLTEPSSSFLAAASSSPQSPDEASQQLKRSLMRSVPHDTPSKPSGSFDSIAAAEPSSTSFNSSQRVVKNGKEVVISSDGDDTDSIEDLEELEEPDNLFMKAAKSEPTPPTDTTNDSSGPGNTPRDLRSRKITAGDRLSTLRNTTPSYKHSLDSLVTDAVDDNETEAAIAKLRAAIDAEAAGKTAFNDRAHNRNLHEGMLASAFGEDDNDISLRRLLDAVRRTEAFDLEKSWYFFDSESTLPPALDFPRDSIPPGSYMDVLRDPDSRERVVHSGMVDFVLSRNFLPDDVIIWIFHSVPTEPKDNLRYAYCRAFKSVNPERIRSLIRPDTISILFERLGASQKALALSTPIVPDPVRLNQSSSAVSQHQELLLSVLYMLREAAALFADDTRQRILNILFRIPLDASLTKNPLLCSELETTIMEMLLKCSDEEADNLSNCVLPSALATIQDPIFQSRLLKHILPITSWIAMLRYRLAISFLLGDPSPLTEKEDRIRDLQRIIKLLKEPRFDVKRYKSRDRPDYDYNELGAITNLLNVAIDSGLSGIDFGSKDAEREFNSVVDTLADRIKKIFTSIEDSGASHLKRTLAKEALEALHYRILYSVRSKPRPKMLFGDYGSEQGDSRYFNSFKPSNDQGESGTEIPIRS